MRVGKKMDLFLGICWIIVFLMNLVLYYNGKAPSRIDALIPTFLLAGKYIESSLSK